MAQSIRRVLSLAPACAAQQLQIVFVCHSEAGGAYRMTEALQSTVDLTRDPAVGVEESVHDIPHGSAIFGNSKILHRDEFGDREAIVNFHHAEFLARIFDARLLVRFLGGDALVAHVAAFPARGARTAPRAQGPL